MVFCTPCGCPCASQCSFGGTRILPPPNLHGGCRQLSGRTEDGGSRCPFLAPPSPIFSRRRILVLEMQMQLDCLAGLALPFGGGPSRPLASEVAAHPVLMCVSFVACLDLSLMHGRVCVTTASCFQVDIMQCAVASWPQQSSPPRFPCKEFVSEMLRVSSANFNLISIRLSSRCHLGHN